VLKGQRSIRTLSIYPNLGGSHRVFEVPHRAGIYKRGCTSKFVHIAALAANLPEQLDRPAVFIARACRHSGLRRQGVVRLHGRNNNDGFDGDLQDLLILSSTDWWITATHAQACLRQVTHPAPGLWALSKVADEIRSPITATVWLCQFVACSPYEAIQKFIVLPLW
jgi:hypothetical protein